MLPGIAIAFVLGHNTTVGAFVAALAMVAGVNVVRCVAAARRRLHRHLVRRLPQRRRGDHEQSASELRGDLNRFLFGSITGVTSADVTRQLVATAITLAAVLVFYRAFLVGTFDERQGGDAGAAPAAGPHRSPSGAAVRGDRGVVRDRRQPARLRLPRGAPATAMLSRAVPTVIAAAAVIGSIAGVVGLLISYHHGTAAGASMALCAVAAFLVGLGGRYLCATGTLRDMADARLGHRDRRFGDRRHRQHAARSPSPGQRDRGLPACWR